MTVFPSCRSALPRAAAMAALLLGGLLSGCAQVGDTIAPAFADPARYDLFDCKQLEAERKSLTGQAADLQRLMDKAQTGAGGVVVSEMVYRNDYISVRARQKLAEEAWRSNKCHETPQPEPAPAAKPAPAKGKRASAKPH